MLALLTWLHSTTVCVCVCSPWAVSCRCAGPASCRHPADNSAWLHHLLGLCLHPHHSGKRERGGREKYVSRWQCLCDKAFAQANVRVCCFHCVCVMHASRSHVVLVLFFIHHTTTQQNTTHQAIAMWKQESDHYTEAQERKRRQRQHRRHHGSKSSSSNGKAVRGLDQDGQQSGVEWAQRRAEIVTAYAKLWEVVSYWLAVFVSSDRRCCRHTWHEQCWVQGVRQVYLWCKLRCWELCTCQPHASPCSIPSCVSR